MTQGKQEKLESKIVSRKKKSLSEVKILRGIIQGHELSTFLFVLVEILLNNILRKLIVGYNLIRS